MSSGILRDLDACNTIKVAAVAGADDCIGVDPDKNLPVERACQESDEDNTVDMISLGHEEDEQEIETGDEAGLYRQMVTVHDEIRNIANHAHNSTSPEVLETQEQSCLEFKITDAEQGEDSSKFSGSDWCMEDLDSSESESWSLLVSPEQF